MRRRGFFGMVLAMHDNTPGVITFEIANSRKTP
jgi:hypothetical protein